MFNSICIYIWVHLQLYEKLYNHRKFVIRTKIRVLIIRHTYNYTSGFDIYKYVYIHLYEYLCIFIVT